MKWKHFETASEYHQFASTVGRPWGREEFGYETGLVQLERGWFDPLPKVEQLIADMQDAEVFAPHMPLPRASLMGSRVRMGAFLAGHPKAMSRLMSEPDQAINTPLRIVVETAVSQGLSDKDILKRGACILAFAMAMQQIRPVELKIVTMSHINHSTEGGLTVKIQSNPIDLGVACAMLLSPSVIRGVNFAAKFSFDGGRFGVLNWRWGLQPTSKKYRERLMAELELGHEDILLSGGHIDDTLMLTNPVQWVKDMIEKHNVRQTEGTE